MKKYPLKERVKKNVSNRYKYTIANLKAFATSKGGECLSTHYTTNKAIYDWRCHEGHFFRTRWADVVNSHRVWCKICSQKKQYLRIPEKYRTRKFDYKLLWEFYNQGRHKHKETKNFLKKMGIRDSRYRLIISRIKRGATFINPPTEKG